MMKQGIGLLAVAVTLSACGQAPIILGAGGPAMTYAQAQRSGAPVSVQRKNDPLVLLRKEANAEFGTVDANKDGVVTTKEYQRYIGWDEDLTAQKRSQMANFAMSDGRLRDNKLDPGEYADLYVRNLVDEDMDDAKHELGAQDLFARFDTNKDKALSVDEFQAAITKAPKDKQSLYLDLFKMCDKARNKADSKLDGTEFHVLSLWAIALKCPLK